MPDPNTTDYSTKKQAELVSLLVQRDQEIAKLTEQARHEAELVAARKSEREKAIATKAPPKLIGSIGVYLQDNPQDILDRAKPLFEGRIPLDRAVKFRLNGAIIPSKDWPIYARLGPQPRVGEEFDADEMPAKDRAHYAARGAIVAIA